MIGSEFLIDDILPSSKDIKGLEPLPLPRAQEVALNIMYQLNKVDLDDKETLVLMDEFLAKLKTKSRVNIKEKRNKERSIFNITTTLTRVREKCYNDATRSTLYPIQDMISWKSYLAQKAIRWEIDELDFTKDRLDWNRAPKMVKRGLIYAFAMFMTTDNKVANNALMRFLMESESLEWTFHYCRQISVEHIHVDSYQRNIFTLIQNRDLLEFIKTAHDTIPSIRNKHRFADKYQNADLPIEIRLLAFMFIEGVFFMSVFSLFYFIRGNTSGIARLLGFQTTTFINIQIGKEETVHRDHPGAILLKGLMTGVYKLDEKLVHDMAYQVQEIETEFNRDATPEPFLGYNPENAINDSKFLINNICTYLGFKPAFPDVIELKTAEMKAFVSSKIGNFYEVSIGEYSSFNPDEAFRRTTQLGHLEWKPDESSKPITAEEKEKDEPDMEEDKIWP